MISPSVYLRSERMERKRLGARSDAQAQRFAVHHGDAARTQTHARAEAQVEVVTQAETLQKSRHEHDERILVTVRLRRLHVFQECGDLVEHNGTDELADVVNELQSSSGQKGKAKRVAHALKQIMPTVTREW